MYPSQTLFDERQIIDELPPPLQKDMVRHLYAGFLRQVPLFHGLDEEITMQVMASDFCFLPANASCSIDEVETHFFFDNVLQLCMALQPLPAMAQDVIMQEGERGSEMYIIVSGEVRADFSRMGVFSFLSTACAHCVQVEVSMLYDHVDDSGNEGQVRKVLGYLHNGSFFGELSLLGLGMGDFGDRRERTVVAVSAVSLTFISKADVDRLRKEHKSLDNQMIQLGARRLRHDALIARKAAADMLSHRNQHWNQGGFTDAAISKREREQEKQEAIAAGRRESLSRDKNKDGRRGSASSLDGTRLSRRVSRRTSIAGGGRILAGGSQDLENRKLKAEKMGRSSTHSNHEFEAPSNGARLERVVSGVVAPLPSGLMQQQQETRPQNRQLALKDLRGKQGSSAMTSSASSLASASCEEEDLAETFTKSNTRRASVEEVPPELMAMIATLTDTFRGQRKQLARLADLDSTECTNKATEHIDVEAVREQALLLLAVARGRSAVAMEGLGWAMENRKNSGE
eukprot:SAG31_NODE_602_length_13638_cov_32.936037_6_plen_514_part_00